MSSQLALRFFMRACCYIPSIAPPNTHPTDDQDDGKRIRDAWRFGGLASWTDQRATLAGDQNSIVPHRIIRCKHLRQHLLDAGHKPELKVLADFLDRSIVTTVATANRTKGCGDSFELIDAHNAASWQIGDFEPCT